VERLIEILQNIRPDVDFINEKSLMDGGFLDSFDIVSIISELDNEYGINVRVTELTPENFNSAESIMKMVERLKNK
jgi:acyl carrier protein